MPVCIINVLLHYTYFSKTLVILHIGCFQNACQHSDKYVKERDSKKKPKHWNIYVYLFVIAWKHMLIHIKSWIPKVIIGFFYFAIPMNVFWMLS